MKYIIFALVTVLNTHLATAVEIAIFDKRGEFPGNCSLVAEDKKYALENYLTCDDGNVSIEVYLSHTCNSKQFDQAVDSESERKSEHVKNSVQFISYDLIDRNSETPIFVRVIKNDLHCVIATSKSVKAVNDALSGLWVEQ